MSAEFHELVRTMELACKRINPPHQPNIAPFSLSDLGADVLATEIEKPQWQYAYLRGLGDKLQQIKHRPIRPWIVQSGHTDSVRALTTLADGRIVSGSGDHTLRVWREQGGAWSSEPLPCSDAKRLVARGNLLFSAGQAVLVWDGSAATQFPAKRQRLFAIDELICTATYHADGAVDTVRITPTALDRLWQISPNFSSPGGKPLPCDPLLHRYAIFLDAKGQHVEVWDCPDQFDWEGLTDNGARTLVLYGKPQTNNLPGAGSE